MIRLSKSTITQLDKDAVMGVLDREFLGMGQEVQLFEQRLSDYLGRPVVCVVNGTAALQLACQAAGIGPGDEVLVQSLTYVASFQAISATGATPIACEVDPNTLTLDCADALSKITAKTKAIMPVHYAGNVGDLDAIYALAAKHDLRVIEDAAHAFGTVHQGQKVGSFGDICCFSFDGIKNLTSGEGGCIVTDDESVIKMIQDARLLGVEKDTEKRYSGERSWTFDVSQQGWRYHMSNMMAALGLSQLARFDAAGQKRQMLASRYQYNLANATSLQPVIADFSDIVPHIYPVLLNKGIDRDGCKDQLLARGIQTGVHYQPNHWLTAYTTPATFPVTDDAYARLLSLPLHLDLTVEDVDTICDTLLSLLA